MTKKQAAQAEAVKVLKEWGVNPASVVYGKVTRVSASGMSRRIQLFIYNDGIINISYHAAKAMGWGYKDGYNGGISVGGCGMDMIFHTIDTLSWAMGYHTQAGEDNTNCYGLNYKQL